MAIALISCPIFAAANTGYDSATLNYTIDKAQKTAPSGLTKQDETIKGKVDGKIQGLTAEMEISTDNANYTAVATTELTLPAGTYYVRYKANDFYYASPATTLTISEGRMLKVTFKIEGYDDIVKEVEWNGTITDIPQIPKKEGYTKDAPYWSINDFTNITSDFTTSAVYLIDGYTVTFVGAGVQNLGSIRVAEGKTFADYAYEISLINDKLPEIYGYTLKRDEETGNPFWSEDVYSADATICSEMYVYAIYVRSDDYPCNVTAYNTLGEQILKDTYVYDQRITLTDENASSWTINNNIVSTGCDAVFYACGTELTICASTKIQTTPTVSLISKHTTSNTFSVFARAHCPDGSKIVKIGIIFSSNTYMKKYNAATNKGILFTLDDTQAFTKKNPSLMKTEYSCSPLETQNFMTTLNKISVGTTRHARAYAVLENGDIIYSTNIISNSLLGYSQIGSAEDEMED